MSRISEEELDELLKNNPHLSIADGKVAPPIPTQTPQNKQGGGSKRKGGHKYNAVRTQAINGRWYASKKEAAYADKLEALKQAGVIDFYLEQVPLCISHRGSAIIYRVDFVTFAKVEERWHIHWVEVKGFKTPVGELKRRLAGGAYNLQIEVV